MKLKIRKLLFKNPKEHFLNFNHVVRPKLRKYYSRDWNFKIKKVHVGQEFAADFEGGDAIDMYGLPFETWHDDGDLMDYITRAMQADRGKW